MRKAYARASRKCGPAHTLFSGKREGERERKIEGENERGRERAKKRE